MIVISKQSIGIMVLGALFVYLLGVVCGAMYDYHESKCGVKTEMDTYNVKVLRERANYMGLLIYFGGAAVVGIGSLIGLIYWCADHIDGETNIK